MDDDLKRYLNDMQAALRRDLNNNTERLLNKMNALERDFRNTKGFLVERRDRHKPPMA
jgi:hypothetical protein